MVKLGFIVEGRTEKIVLEKSDFFNHLKSLSIDFIPEVMNAEGSGELLPQNIDKYTEVLVDKGATNIFVLTDLDEESCITNRKTKIAPLQNHVLVISVKQIEAWFLSDTDCIRIILNDPNYTCDFPESFNAPFEEIKSLRIVKHGRGTGDKKRLAKNMTRSGFSILKAAQHPQCTSAKYFLNKINQFSQTV